MTSMTQPGPEPPPRVEGGKPAVEVERDDLRELLRAIVEALDVPDGAGRSPLLDRRSARIVEALRAVLTGKTPSPGIPWETAFLRMKTAEDRPVPYALTARTLGGDV
ncbi:hypothetical protein ACFY1J_31200 [Streptomyces sp. NPDC001406]|uniref:hypothetical protein n=1 Tax=Streptomyces sp. NPDC001406 TaxID=3364572 RepID=UPI003699FCDB